jgi:hypothetical protein
MKFYPCNRTKCRFYRKFSFKDDGGITVMEGPSKKDPLVERQNEWLAISLLFRCVACKYFKKQELYCK